MYTVDELYLELVKQREQGNGDLPVVMMDPIRAQDYFNRKIKTFPLSTIEHIRVRGDFADEGGEALYLSH